MANETGCNEPVDSPGQQSGSGHGPDGRFVLGNPSRRSHGLYARQQPEDIRLSAKEFTDGVVSDLGGLDELSTMERGYASHLSTLSVTLQLLTNNMATHGLFTPAGNVRSVYGQFLAGLDRFDRLARRLPLGRRPKAVLGPLEWMDAPDQEQP